MGESLNQTRLLTIIARIADLEYAMMTGSARQQLRMNHVTDLNQKRAFVKSNKIKQLQEQGVENTDWSAISQIINDATAEYDTEISMIELQDEQWESELKLMETEIQSLQAEKTEIEKLQDKAIKEGHGYFKNSN